MKAASFLRRLLCLLLGISLYTAVIHGQVINPCTLPQEWADYGIGDPYLLSLVVSTIYTAVHAMTRWVLNAGAAATW
jgi:hypothetical protein